MSESVTGTDRTVELTRCREFRLTDAMILFSRGALAFWASSRLLLLLADMLGRPCREAIVHRADLLTQWSLFCATLMIPSGIPCGTASRRL